LLQRLLERRDAGLTLRIVCGPVHEHANAPHPLGLLPARDNRPCRRSTERREEGAPFQLIELHSVPCQHRIARYRIGGD